MDKATLSYQFEVVNVTYKRMPGYPAAKKTLKSLAASTPKAIAERLKVDTLVSECEAFMKNGNPFPDFLDALGKKLAYIVEEIPKLDDELFDSRRGRDVENEIVKLYGKDAKVPEHAMNLLKGSKLQTYLVSGPGDMFDANDADAWKDFQKVLNLIKSTLTRSIPEQFANKRKTSKDDAENSQTETEVETTEGDDDGNEE